MDAGFRWLENIALAMKAAVSSGAAPTSEQLTIRELLKYFEFAKRGSWINWQIRNGLEKHNLIVRPDFTKGWLDDKITISLDPDTVDRFRSTPKPDPTLRIGDLEAANKKPQGINPQSLLSEATTIMLLHNYSQLPVMTSEREVKGMISWKTIGYNLSMEKVCTYVSDCMEEAQEVRANLPLLDAISVIDEHDYVLVRGADNIIIGIVTASDLSLQFMQLAGRFLFIEEIERHLRRLIDGKFTIGELQQISYDQRPIESIDDFTFGEYIQLLDDKDNWDKLGLKVGHKTFLKHLEEVRLIRNTVVHFQSYDLSDSSVEKLRGMARLLRNLAGIGAI